MHRFLLHLLSCTFFYKDEKEKMKVEFEPKLFFPPIVEQCAALKWTSDRLLRTCLHPIANDSFNSTCAFSCEEGFELSGQSVTICDHAGRWTAEVPTCSGKGTFFC